MGTRRARDRVPLSLTEGLLVEAKFSERYLDLQHRGTLKSRQVQHNLLALNLFSQPSTLKILYVIHFSGVEGGDSDIFQVRLKDGN